jgi:hypothetical protein
MNIYELRKKVNETLAAMEVVKNENDWEAAHLYYDRAVDLIITYHAKVLGTRYNDVISELCKKIKAAEPSTKWYT